jgi:hypothetical protein
VRTYEPATDRSRGGSRPGIQKYVTQQIPEGFTKIQHLQAVILHDDSALLNQDPFGPGSGGPPGGGAGGTVDDPSTPGDPRTWGYDIFEDPVTHVRTKRARKSRVPIPPQKIRKGGSAIGHPHNTWTNKKKAIVFEQANSQGFPNSASIVPLPMNGVAIQAGDLIVTCSALDSGVSVASIADTQTNTYNLVDSVTNGSNGLFIHYAFANADAAEVDITLNPTGNCANAFGVLIFRNASASDATGHATGSGNPWSTGIVGVNTQADLLIGAFAEPTLTNQGGTHGVGFTLAVFEAPGAQIALFVEYKLNVAASQAATFTGFNAAASWLASGTSWE